MDRAFQAKADNRKLVAVASAKCPVEFAPIKAVGSARDQVDMASEFRPASCRTGG